MKIILVSLNFWLENEGLEQCVLCVKNEKTIFQNDKTIKNCITGHEFMQHNHFGSFAPERKEQVAKYFICGQDYMSAVADAILQAQEEIYIAGWWLSPEIYLKRGSEFHENMRLDRLLKKKAVSHNV